MNVGVSLLIFAAGVGEVRAAEIDDVRSIYSCWVPSFLKKWIGGYSDAQLTKMSDRYIELCREEVAVASTNKVQYAREKEANARIALGDALLYRDRFAEAIEQYSMATGVYDNAANVTGYTVRYRLAECQFSLGNRKAACATLKTIRDAGVSEFRGRYDSPCGMFARTSLEYLENEGKVEVLDRLGLPLHTGAMAYPTAQKAEYSENFKPLEAVALKLSGVDEDDARIKLLQLKVAKKGVKFAAKGYPLAIELSAKAPVEKNEGYSLEVTDKGAKIMSRDKQGILWGIVSFIQVFKDGTNEIRLCKIEDWPDCPHRGYLGSWWISSPEFALFNKLNMITDQGSHPFSDGGYSPLNLYLLGAHGKVFRDFGLDYYISFLHYTMDMGWPYTKRYFLDMQVHVAKKIAKLGVNIYYPNDDSRYPINPEDAATGKNASDFDAPHIAEFYRQVHAEYPDFKLIYCPPFYWGPDSNVGYPDDREKYLKSMRLLPPEVQLYWTGGQVKGYDKFPYQVKWFTELTGHKPTIFQNGTGPHNLLSYVVDDTDWNGWHYAGFFENDIVGFQKNSTTPSECPQISALAGCLWNPKNFDCHASTKRAIQQLLGKDMYDILKPGLKPPCVL